MFIGFLVCVATRSHDFSSLPFHGILLHTLSPLTALGVVIRQSLWYGEGGNMDKEMMKLKSTKSEMIEEITGNRRCGSGCGRPGVGERRQEDTRQSRCRV